jgi:hypothetical protein
MGHVHKAFIESRKYLPGLGLAVHALIGAIYDHCPLDAVHLYGLPVEATAWHYPGKHGGQDDNRKYNYDVVGDFEVFKHVEKRLSE